MSNFNNYYKIFFEKISQGPFQAGAGVFSGENGDTSSHEARRVAFGQNENEFFISYINYKVRKAKAFWTEA